MARFNLGNPWRRPIWIGVLAVGVVVLVTGVAFRRPLPDDPLERIARLEAAGRPRAAESVFDRLPAAAWLDLDLNYRYVINHFEIPPREREDDRVIARYRSLAGRPESADVGRYGLGLYHSLRHEYREALEQFEQVEDRSLKYLNNSIGRVLVETGDPGGAEVSFRREIEARGNVQGAVGNLAEMYLSSGRLDRMRELVKDERTGALVNAEARRSLAFRSGDLPAYAWFVLVVPWIAIRVGAGLAALLIYAMWFVYLWRIDIFEQEPLGVVVATTVLGALSAPASTVLTDVLAAIIGLERSDTLAFYIGYVGLVEEIAKLVPVWLIVRFSRQVNEPVDFLIYGCLSALGFATLENAHYFTRLGLGVAFGRFLFSTVLHMALTSVVCYAWARGAFGRRPGARIPLGLGGLAVAAVLHGLYDYSLAGQAERSAVAVLIALVLSCALGWMIKLSLKSSPFFDLARSVSGRLRNMWLMVLTAAGMQGITYLYENFAYATDIADMDLLANSGWAILSVSVVFGALGEIRLGAGRGS